MQVRLRDGVRLFVDVDGAGLRPHDTVMRSVPTLVLVHGGPGFDHSSFKAFLARLSERWQLVYYDHRGMGRSDAGARSDWALETWAADLADLIAVLGIRRPVLFGQSFGGFVAMRCAAELSDRLGGLVLSSTAARHVAADCLDVFERLGGADARAAATAFFEDPTDATFARYRRVCMPLYNVTPQDPLIGERQLLSLEVLYAFWRGEHRHFDLRPRLRDVRCPTLILCGEQDPITPPPRSHEIFSALDPAVARLEVFAGAGHGVFRDVPAVFDDVLTGFVDSLAARPPGRTPFAG